MLKKIRIGIDPGKTGHIVFLDADTGEVLRHVKTPLIGKEYDKHAMFQLLMNEYPPNAYAIYAVLEDVHTTQMGGKASNFDFGRGKGLWEMALIASNIPHTMIGPKIWQKEVWVKSKIQYKPGKKKKTIDTKATSLITAKMSLPNQDFIDRGKSGRGTKVDDGFVDAYLIAEYCRRKF